MMKKVSKWLCGAFIVCAIATAGPVQGGVMATGQIDSGFLGIVDTDIFTIINQSTSGETITSFTIDLTGNDTFFDTTATPPGTSSRSFSIDPASDNVGALFPLPASVDGETAVTITTTDFAAGETFIFGVDLDLISSPDDNPTGEQLIGSILTVNFSDGSILSGAFGPSGTLGIGAEVTLPVTNPVPEPSSLALLGIAGLGTLVYRRRRELKS